LSGPPRIDILEFTFGLEGDEEVRLSATNTRTRLTSRVLRASTLVFLLPTVLLVQLNSELVLLHSDCDGDPHFHTLDAADLDGSVRNALSDHCCGDPGATPASGTAETPGHDCGHDQPPLIIAKSAFVATRAEPTTTLQLPKASYTTGLDFVPCALRLCGPQILILGAREPPHAAGDGAAAVLLRNHALLL
jgi:hypothetical protein